MTTTAQFDQDHQELDLEQLYLLAVQYYRLHRRRHFEFHEMRRIYEQDRPNLSKRTVRYNFLREDVVRDVIDGEQMYARFALVNATMYLMEVVRRGGAVPYPIPE
jgi:hypothetical protein